MIRKKRLTALIAVGLVVLAAIWYWGQSKGVASSKGGSPEGTPVRIARADVRDMPHYVSSIGTVQAFNTVLVRARVDGEISRVAFREGQNVRRGDVLIELDRRPFEARLHSSQAQEDKDMALLENAKVDLPRYEFLLQTDSAPGRCSTRLGRRFTSSKPRWKPTARRSIPLACNSTMRRSARQWMGAPARDWSTWGTWSTRTTRPAS